MSANRKELNRNLLLAPRLALKPKLMLPKPKTKLPKAKAKEKNR